MIGLETLAQKWGSWCNRSGRVDRSGCAHVDVREVWRAAAPVQAPKGQRSAEWLQYVLTAAKLAELQAERLPRLVRGDWRTAKSAVMRPPGDTPEGRMRAMLLRKRQKASGPPMKEPRVSTRGYEDIIRLQLVTHESTSHHRGMPPAAMKIGNLQQHSSQLASELASEHASEHASLQHSFFIAADGNPRKMSVRCHEDEAHTAPVLRSQCGTRLPVADEQGLEDRRLFGNPNQGATRVKRWGVDQGWSQRLMIEGVWVSDRLTQHYFQCAGCQDRAKKLFMILATQAEWRDAELARLWLRSQEARRAVRVMGVRSADELRVIERYGALWDRRVLRCAKCLGLRWGEVRKNKRDRSALSQTSVV